MPRRVLGLLLAVCCLCAWAGACAEGQMQKRTMYFFDTFDTMITIIGYTGDQATFDRVTQEAKQRFIELHRLFDAYNAYEGIQNIYTLNRDAHMAPVKVAPDLMGLLLFAKEWQPKLHGTTNIAMGSVLQLWHADRAQATDTPEQAKIPSMEQLQAAATHTDMDSVIINQEDSTVFMEDPQVQLDVGAVAKGYAAEVVAKMLLNSDMPHFIINAGGNVRAGLPPMDGRKSWGVSIQDPEKALDATAADPSLDVLYLADRSVVTSGDYQRFYLVDGVRYHHIISPATLMPAMENRAVTIVCEDSGLADILSTAVFILPYEEGRALVESMEGVEALWVREDGEVLMTEGLKAISKSGGASANADMP